MGTLSLLLPPFPPHPCLFFLDIRSIMKSGDGIVIPGWCITFFVVRFFNRTRGDHSVAFHHQQQQSDRQTRAPLPYPALASLPAGGPYPSHEHKIRWTWYQVPGIYYSMCFFFERCHLLHYYTKYSGVSIIMRCGSNPL